MRILLFGKGGQLGWELQRSLAPLGELVALDFDSTEFCGDFTNPAGIAQTVQAARPDLIVNAAAHTAVDKAESEPELVRTINALAPATLAQQAAALGAWLVHYSTDYVFDGSGERPWREQDKPGPLNIYGQTKLDGERAIVDSGAKHLIFRTSWVYAARGGNFAKTMLRLARERDRLSVINDQVGAPTGAELLADVTAHALRQVTASPDGVNLAGLYHLSAAGQTSWHGYASFVLETALKMGATLKASPATVDPVPTTSFPTPARRPLNSRLDTSKLQRNFNLVLPPWQQGVARMLAETL
jgi:dTDP-4-dehydrorhamnose reductase